MLPFTRINIIARWSELHNNSTFVIVYKTSLAVCIVVLMIGGNLLKSLDILETVNIAD